MIKFGQHPRTGDLVKVVKCISRQPALYRCQVIAGDRIYYTNYTGEKLERKFDPLSSREFNKRAKERRQLRLFDLEAIETIEPVTIPEDAETISVDWGPE